MKKIILSFSAIFIFLGLAFTYSSLYRPHAEEIAVTPVTPPTSGGLATGGIKANAGGYTLTLDFNAHGSPLMGKVNYSDSLGMNFRGTVDSCYNQSGNNAVFSGSIDKGNVPGSYFLVEVQDNGEGKNASTNDMVGVSWTNTKPVCAVNSSLLNALVQKGNLQVHAQ